MRARYTLAPPRSEARSEDTAKKKTLTARVLAPYLGASRIKD